MSVLTLYGINISLGRGTWDSSPLFTVLWEERLLCLVGAM